MRVLVCGDRNWRDERAIRRELERLPSRTIIVHGAARGADSIAGEVAADLGLKVERYPADWTKYGRAAGPIRNAEMLRTGIDKVLAFHPDISTSRGTKDMVERARKAGVPAEVFDR